MIACFFEGSGFWPASDHSRRGSSRTGSKSQGELSLVHSCCAATCESPPAGPHFPPPPPPPTLAAALVSVPSNTATAPLSPRQSQVVCHPAVERLRDLRRGGVCRAER